MEIKYYKNINKIKKEWKSLFENDGTCPTLDFDFVKYWNSSLKQKKHCFGKGKIRYLVISDKDEILIVLPVLQKNEKTLSSIYLLDYYDVLINKKLTLEKAKDILLNYLKENDITFQINGLNENSLLYKMFSLDYNVEQTDKCSVIKINNDAENEFDEFYNNLSKSTRQNIRTMYNRLQSDKKDFALIEIDNKNYKKYSKKLKNLYVTRRKKRYKNINFVLYHLYKIKEPILDSISKSKGFKGYALKIGDNIVSYLAGITKENYLYIPRLVVDDDFKRYSPGILLICEIIKQNNGKLKYLDLSSGSEDYKATLGGIEHKNYTLTIGKRDLND